MGIVKVKDKQTLIDVSVQCLGGVAGVFALAERNNMSITARLREGMELGWDEADVVNGKVQQEYASRGLYPSTEIEPKTLHKLLHGEELTKEEHKLIDRTEEILTELEAGREWEPKSNLSLTRILDKPFNKEFA